MVRDLAGGYILPTVRTFSRLKPAELAKVEMELDRKLREVRGQLIDLDDIDALKLRNRQLLRITSARRMLQSHKQTLRR